MLILGSKPETLEAVVTTGDMVLTEMEKNLAEQLGIALGDALKAKEAAARQQRTLELLKEREARAGGSVTLTAEETHIAGVLGLNEAEVLGYKEQAERERTREVLARAKAQESIELTPMELELGKQLGISPADLLRAKAGPKVEPRVGGYDV